MPEGERAVVVDVHVVEGLERGTGLGLSSAYGIIKGHGGFIDVASKQGNGTCFEIYLPASSEESNKGKEIATSLDKGKEVILLVDDESIVIDVGKEMLKGLGYTPLIARGGKEAIEVFRKNQDQIGMVILDMIMPDLHGGEVFDRLKEINSDIKVILSSGYSLEGEAQRILDRGCDGFIQKPFNLKQFSLKIRETFEGAQPN